jgi:hypothetical protein
VVKYVLLLFAVALLAPADDITPKIGVVEVFGAHKVSPDKIRSALGAGPGDHLPIREEAEERIDAVSGVLTSYVEAICCDGGKPILYVGIEEKNGIHLDFHPAPTGDIALSQEILDKYSTLLDSLGASLRGNTADEDLTHGYSLSADAEVRAIQESLIPLVDRDFANVQQAIRESGDASARAAATYVLQYASRTPHTSKEIGDTLQYALQDPASGVRENALAALKAVMVGARLHPEQGIHIAPTWFIELMNSLQWSDRHSASLALLTFTERRNPEVLAQLRDRALPSVLEMARWHDLKHALPGFILAGRLAGWDEKQIQEAWVNGDRETVLARAQHPNGKPSAVGSVLHHTSK